MTTTNPFHRPPAPMPPAESVEDLEPDPLWDDAVSWNGPPTPPPSAPVEAGPARSTVEVLGAPGVCVMGLHGGAGATTVADLLAAGDLGAGSLDVGTSWPVPGGWARPRPVLPVLVVARTHYRGLDAATTLARQWAAGLLGQVHLVGLVLVDDGPNLTAAQRRAARQVGRMTPHGWHLPWHEPWRLGAPDLPTAPIRVRRVMKSITTATKEHR